MKSALRASFFALLGSATLAAAATNANTFFIAKTYAVGNSPVCIATGDFNGDGKLDIVTGDRNDSAVAVLTGVGNGTFKPVRNFVVDSAPTAVQAVDLNGDGKLDLVVATGLDIFVLLGNGDGTFRVGGAYASGTSPTYMTLGDFNGDGKVDVALSSDNTGVSGVILGNGDGTFQAFKSVSNQLIGPVAAGDFNGDGKVDLVIANDGITESSAGVAVLTGNGDGSFIAPNQFPPFTIGFNPKSIAVGDFNNDGHLDAVIGNGIADFALDQIAVAFGDGNGHVGNFRYVSSGGVPSSVAAADVNGDGNLDVVVGNSWDSDVTVLIGNGRGMFTASANYVAGNGLPVAVAIGDFNGDGKTDIATANQVANNVSVLLATGAGKFNDARDYRVGEITQYAATGDFNHDGKQDLVVSSYLTGLSLSLGNGNGTFKPPVSVSSTLNGPVVAADLNGDGFLDLIALGTAGSNVNVLINNGDGTFAAPVAYFAGSNAVALAVGDFNNDGKMDLAVSIKSFVSILLGNGDGSLQSPMVFSAGSQPTGLAVGDFNADGKLDIATGDLNGSDIAVIFGKGDGTFRPAQFTQVASSQVQTLATGFFHGKGPGRLDIAALSPDGHQFLVLVNNGNGTFNGFTYAVGPGDNQPTSMAVGDFNLDGKLDVALAASGSNATVLFGDGTDHFSVTTFGSGGGTSIGSPQFLPVSVVSADFNGDTKQDLAVIDGNHSFTVLLNQTK
ncbi:MAG TPA: VCBS repeat-containing protein [Candidatus Solibacter sp.]|nr:VCBS repeat-containing protein [Candidatus Solibacter sp.]